MLRPMALAASLVILTSLPVTAEIYKWVDEKGVTHYSDSEEAAPAGSQPVDESLPHVHDMQRPDPALRKATQPPQRRVASTGTRASSQRAHSRCNTLQQQLKRIQAQLRKGYREPRGNRLRERRRHLQAEYNNSCR